MKLLRLLKAADREADRIRIYNLTGDVEKVDQIVDEIRRLLTDAMLAAVNEIYAVQARLNNL